MALIEQKEAARLLGVSEEEITNMVSRQELFGYRDGAAWKFKMDELQRVADERGVELGAEPPAGGGSGIDNDLYDEMVDVTDLPEEDDSILVSEEALGRSGMSTGSTIIGGDDVIAEEGSDIQKAIDGGTDIEDAGISLAADSGLDLDGGDDLLAGSDVTAGSDLDLGEEILGASGVLSDVSTDDDGSLGLGSGTGGDVLELDDDDDDVLVGGSDTGASGLDSMLGIDLSADSGVDTSIGSSDSSDDDDALLELDDEGDDETPTQLAGSLDSDTSFELGEEDDDDFVIGAGSDVTLGVGDSGIGLTTPKDSGISLEEEPLDLMGSQVGELELGEGDLELDEDADPEAATQLKAEDDFGLTPVEMDLEEESDSGSQVIALDTEQFDETADTMLAAAPAMLEEDELMDDQFGGDPLAQGAAMGAAAAPGFGASPMMQQAPAAPEAKFSIWNVLSLMVIMLMLTVTGMLMADVIKNMWEFDQANSANQAVMEKVLSIIGE